MENSNIYFDIVPINEKYRGIERSLTGAEPLDTIKKEKLKRKERKKRYKIFESYLEDYCEYFEWWSSLLDCLERQSLKKAIQYQEKFTEYGVACEIMLSTENPIDSVLDYPIEFLGIDIIDEWNEAPLSSVFDGVPWNAQKLLNENGLCTNDEVAEAVMTMLEGDYKKMKKIYIYKLKGF